ncbi:MAG TPA: hypothetical protein VGH52_11615, partial [Gaiellaceae bacterium]
GFHVGAGETSATLDALVDPGGENTSYFFQYGLTSAYGNQVDSTDQVAATSDPTPVDLQATGLNANTTYHYRAGAEYADGTVVYGGDQTFTTTRPDGSIDVQLAAAVGATLQVDVENVGLEKGAEFRVDAVTQAQFAQNEFDQAFQSKTTTAFQPVPSDQLVSQYTVNLRNLQPGTTYYAVVRFQQTVGSGAQNWLQTGIVSFTTGGFVSTEPATEITRISATLHGIASGAGPYHFIYYPVDHPDNTTTIKTVESYPGADELTHEDYTAAVDGLDPGTRYVFNLVGSDRQGTPVDVDTLGGKCPAGAEQVDEQTIPNTQFTVSGCWLGATPAGDLPDGTSTYKGIGTLSINGMAFTPASSTGTVSINIHTNTLSTSGAENIAVGTTSLYSTNEAPLSVVFDGSDSHFILAANQVSADAAVFGFPIAGATVVSPQDDGGTEVTTLIGMPAIFGSDAGLQTILDVDKDGTVEEPTLKASTAFNLGPIEMPSLSLTHEEGTKWEGEAELKLPGAGVFAGDKGIDASIEITGDELTGLGVAVHGIEIPLGASGVVINSIGAELGDKPFHLQGDIGMDVGPEIGKFSALDVEASVYLAINSQEELPSGIPGVTAGKEIQSPFTLKVHGEASLLGLIPIADADVDYYGLSQPFVAFKAGINADLTVGDCPGQSDRAFGVTAGGTIAGAFQGNDFNLEGDLGVKLRFACLTVFGAEADTAISSDGIAFCGSLTTPFGALSVGAGEKWGSAGTSISTDSIGKNLTFYGVGADNGACSVSDYEHKFDLAAPRREAASAVAVPDLTFPAGKQFAVVKFVGTGGPPLVSISGPDGRSVSTQAGKPTVDAKHGFLVLPDARTNVTTVSIAKPGTGAYHVTLEAGSPPLRSVESASGLPMPNVQARVTGTGRTRILSWGAAKVAGQSLVFEESGAGGEHVILRTAKTSGRLSFSPVDGRAGKRNLIVVVLEHGVQRQIVHAATFQAPKPQRPLVRNLRVRRQGSTVKVTWASSGPRASYDVQLTTSAGLNLRVRTTKKQATFTRVAHDFGGVVTVRPTSGALVAGPAQHATLLGGPQLTLRSIRLTVTRKGDVSIPVRCGGGRCRSVLDLDVRGAHGPVRVALGTALLSTGHASVVTLHLTKKGENLLKGHKSILATLTVSTADSTTFTRRITLISR